MQRAWVSALIGAIGTIFAATVAGLVTTDWFPELLGYRTSEIHVKRTELYARILYFQDRAKGGIPFQKKRVGLDGSQSQREVQLFDEALYIKSYYLRRHKVETMPLGGFSSGIIDVTPIIPSEAGFDTDAYDKSGGHTLPFTLDIKDKEYLLVAYHYYNGYQYNKKFNRYESDGGIHIKFPTDEVIVIFDFSALNYSSLLESDPKLFIRKAKGEEPRQLPANYVKGVLVSSPILNPPVDAIIHADWEWSSEGSSSSM